MDESTLRPPPRRTSRQEREGLFLTLLCHPDLSRVGEYAKLELGAQPAMDVGRSAPFFVSAGGGQAAPLADRYVSRRLLRIERAGTGIRLVPQSDAPVRIDGRPLTAPLELPRMALEDGVALTLQGRAALWLHRRPEYQTAKETLGLVGQSAVMDRLRQRILAVAPDSGAALIRGETGTGKELVARALHAQSGRPAGAWVATNMATLTPSTAVSQLFGHRAGAFTGASRDHRGLFEQSSGGTLFLDEIGEAAPEIQAMLLRALETGEITPLGASRPVRVEVRVLAATDAPLGDGDFRAALLHRLAASTLEVPPLRERREDVALLTVEFLRSELRALGGPPLPESWLTPDTMVALTRYDWPGNVRQLRHLARSLLLAGRSAEEAPFDPSELTSASRMPSPSIDAGTLDDDTVLEVLRAHRWRTGAAASALGISKTTLYAWIDRHPRVRKAKDVPLDELRRVHARCGGELEAMSAALEVSARGLSLRLKDTGLARASAAPHPSSKSTTYRSVRR